MPQESQYNSLNIGFGDVPKRTPIRMNLDAYQRAFDKIDDRHQKALEQRTVILNALRNIKLNEAEDSWKQRYIDNILAKIDNAAQFGSYSSALGTATQLAGEAISDPALIGRERANAEYEKRKAQVESNNQLNQVTKDRWLAQNPYTYKDKYDDKGNVVGGTNWTPNWNPVNRYDMTRLYELTKQLAAKEAGGGESAQFLDENGNLTSDPSKGFYGMAIKRGSKWERLSEDKLKNVFNALFKQAPEAMDSMLQDMDDRKWQYDNATESDKKAFIGSDIMNEQGVMRTPEEYLAYRVNPVLSSMAYNNVWSSVDFGQAYAQRQKDLKDRAARVQLQGLEDLNNTTLTVPIEIDYKDKAATAYATISDAMATVNNLWRGTMQSDKKAKDLLNDRDYEGLADYLESKIHPKLRQETRRRAIGALNALRDQGASYKTLVEGLGKEEREAAEFLFAKESGATLPNAKDNRFSERYSRQLNGLFSYKDPKNPKNNVAISNVFVSFQDSDQKAKVLTALGLDERSLKQHGLQLKTINGRESLVINKNTDLLSEIADAFINVGDKWWSTSKATVGKLDNDGSVVSNNLAPYTAGIQTLKSFTSDNAVISKARNLTENAFNAKDITSIQTMQVLPFDDRNTMMLNQAYINGYITREEKNDLKKEYTDNNLKEAGMAFNRLSNFSVYGLRDENGNLVKLTPKEREEAQLELQRAYALGQIELSPSGAPTGNGYGTLIHVKQKDKTSNSEAVKDKVFYIDGLFSGKASQYIASDPDFRARHKYQSDRGANIIKKDVAGNRVAYGNEQVAIMQYKALDDLNEIYRKIDATGQKLTSEEATAIATELLIESGYNPTSNSFYNALGSLKAKLENY